MQTNKNEINDIRKQNQQQNKNQKSTTNKNKTKKAQNPVWGSYAGVISLFDCLLIIPQTGLS